MHSFFYPVYEGICESSNSMQQTFTGSNTHSYSITYFSQVLTAWQPSDLELRVPSLRQNFFFPLICFFFFIFLRVQFQTRPFQAVFTLFFLIYITCLYFWVKQSKLEPPQWNQSINCGNNRQTDR